MFAQLAKSILTNRNLPLLSLALAVSSIFLEFVEVRKKERKTTKKDMTKKAGFEVEEGMAGIWKGKNRTQRPIFCTSISKFGSYLKRMYRVVQK